MHAEASIGMGEGAMRRPPDFLKAVFKCDFQYEMKDTALAHVRSSVFRGLPQLLPEDAKEGSAIIVGGGPSLVDTEDELRALAEDPANRVYVMNDAHDWLLERGIPFWGAVFNEVIEWPCDWFNNARFDRKYLIASLCHPSAFDRLEAHDVVIWHCQNGIGEEEIIARAYDPVIMVCGGSRASLRTINIALCQGFSDFHLFGLDSSFPENAPSHAYYDESPEAYRDTIPVWCAGRNFNTSKGLARQADDFRRYCEVWHRLFTMQVHGDSLLSHIHRTGWPGQYE